MDSFYWEILSEIFLGIGIVLLLVAVFLAFRYRIISNIISDVASQKRIPAIPDMPPPVTPEFSKDTVGDYPVITGSSEPFADESGEITVVVARGKKQADDGATVVVDRAEEGKESDFRITRNIILINADPDVIDGGSI